MVARQKIHARMIHAAKTASVKGRSHATQRPGNSYNIRPARLYEASYPPGDNHLVD